MALHLGEFLKRFGPVHGWWTFPFERLIGMLQRISTNGKIGGELEQTIALSYTRTASLRSLFAKSCCPQTIRETESIFTKFINTRSENHLVTEMMSLVQAEGTPASAEDESVKLQPAVSWNDRTAVPVPTALHNALRRYLRHVPYNLKVQMKKNLTMDGISFSVASKNVGNSSVMIWNDDNSTATPARIDHILQYLTSKGTVDTILGVSRYRPWTGKSDPFAGYHLTRTRLWQREVEDLIFVGPSRIGAHFAHMNVHLESKDAMVVVTLERILDLATLVDNSDIELM